MNTNRRHAVAALIAAGLRGDTTVPLSQLPLEGLPPGRLTGGRLGRPAAVLRAAAAPRGVRGHGSPRTRPPGSALRAAFTPAVLIAGAFGYGGSVMVQN